jgi:hypothetical protein
MWQAVRLEKVLINLKDLINLKESGI